MSTSTEVKVFGKTYKIKSSEFEIDPHEIAAYVDSKMKKLGELRDKNPNWDLAVLVSLNLAQEILVLNKKVVERGEKNEKKVDALIQTLENELETLSPADSPPSS